MFFTAASRHVYVSQDRISLSSAARRQQTTERDVRAGGAGRGGWKPHTGQLCKTQTSNLLGELLALDVHVLDVDLPPGRGLPVLDAGAHDEDVVPQLLEHAQLLAALAQLLELGDQDLEQRAGVLDTTHLRLVLRHAVVGRVQLPVRVIAVVPAHAHARGPAFSHTVAMSQSQSPEGYRSSRRRQWWL